MQSLSTVVVLALVATETAGLAITTGVNSTSLRSCAKSARGTSYGKNKCRCVGIDNLKGYYATQEDFYHVQRTAETGASCEAWDDGKHPKCKGTPAPAWCRQSWCYVDPCSCDLDILPKMTIVGVEYQGSPAYWSYDTCGSTDFFSADMAPEDSCVKQKTAGDCGKNSKCAWDGKQCGGKEVVKTCKELEQKDETVVGQEDCRCVGTGGKDVGKAFMYINDKEMIAYPANVGATCEAWEEKTHPDCLKDGDKPSWCSAKWCIVDPCKCKTKVPPKTVMPANTFMRFQGKTAYWSYATCGSVDTWSSGRKGQYCTTQTDEAGCNRLDKCAWDGKQCLGKALVEICAKQEATGILGMESPLESGASAFKVMLALLALATSM